jgi:L-iditol 2-dehydrogenase
VNVATTPASRRAELVSKPDPAARDEYVVIRVDVAPMCNEYLAYRDRFWLERNRYDSLGHEAAGVVVDVDRTSAVKVGDRVVALCGFPCGACVVCRTGRYGHCPAPVDPLGRTGNTSGECCFAQYALKADWLLEPIPDDLTTAEASLACCGLGPTFGAMELMGVGQGDTVLVAGLGPVGLGGVLNAVARGATAIGLARNRARGEMARALGAALVLDPTDPSSDARIRAVTGGLGVDHAIDTTGQPFYEQLALRLVRPAGQMTFLSEGQDLVINVERDILVKGVTLRGHLDINRRDVTKLFDVIRRVRGRLSQYVTHAFDLADIGQAWERQSAGECGKVLLYPWGTPVGALGAH